MATCSDNEDENWTVNEDEDEDENWTPNEDECGTQRHWRSKDITNTYSVNQIDGKTALHKEDTFVDDDPKSLWLRANVTLCTVCVI